MACFARYIGIDYSGAETVRSSLPGLRVYEATPDSPPGPVLPPPSPRKHWTRRGIAEWLLEELRDGPPTLVGIDHAFSFPLRYFEVHHLQPDWNAFLEDFCEHWPTDADLIYVQDVREGRCGKGADRGGNSRWRRLAEQRSGSAKSVFHFDVQGSVAKSTHAGIPWLRYLRKELGPRLHFWPFDGWEPSAGRSVIAEVYPSLWSKSYPREDRSPDQHDAYSVARWMREKDAVDELDGHFCPALNPFLKGAAQVEGWILGID
ncbi:MAG: hypothetical protein MUF31_14480 [Akkermansiaceae bacterium]|jgi:hypothetical protein|nr:hypothetical protein [Akkermansiaceae bacterium]